MSNFNKSLLGKNIKYLATKKGIKVGEIEAEAGVSVGYLSRLANEDNKNNFPIMDLILLISEKLDISVNTLINIDLSSLTPNEVFLSQFFDKLFKDTSTNSIIWEVETKSKLEDINYIHNHPLFARFNYEDHFEMRYRSLFDNDVHVEGDFYKVVLENKLLYLTKVNNSNLFTYGYELYFINNTGYLEKICKIYEDSDLFKQLDDLYKAATESSRHVKLTESVIETINEYLSPTKPEDIPF